MTSVAFKQEDVAFQLNLYEDSNATRRSLHGARRNWVESRLREYLGRGTKVLEVGVGCGIFTRFLHSQHASVTAVDINPDFIAAVTGLSGVRAQVRDATEPMKLGEHDLALCSEVIEHVPPDRSVALLTSIAGCLRPGGRLILTTPQRFANVELMARMLKFRPILALARRLYGAADELGHINLMTRGELRRQIAQAGFEIERQDLFGFYLPVVAEFGGEAGARLLGRLGTAIADWPIVRGMLWTQAYVLRKR